MASHDAVPHEIVPPGTTLYRCVARPGDVVVIHAMGRFRAARVTRVGPKRAYLIHPAANPNSLPHQPTRPLSEVYALVGTEIAGVVSAGECRRYGHSLTTPNQPECVVQTRALCALGEAVRQERERAGFSAVALAAASGIQTTKLQALEAGQLDADFDLLVALTQALKTRLSKLFSRAEALGI
jgi:hypothetical protein